MILPLSETRVRDRGQSFRECLTIHTCLMQKDAHPAHFFLCAAQAAIERRKCAQRATSQRGGAKPNPLPETPVLGHYLGQLAFPSSQRRLTEEEFLHHLEVCLDINPSNVDHIVDITSKRERKRSSTCLHFTSSALSPQGQIQFLRTQTREMTPRD